MRTETKLDSLRNAVGLAERVAGKHATLPVLSCVLIEAKKGTVSLRATNLDVGMEVDIPAKTDSAGIIAVPAHTLSAFLSQAPGNNPTVTMESSGENLSISVPRSKGNIKSMSPEDFPSIPEVSQGRSFSLPAEALIKGMKAVWYSAAVSNVKPELASIYIYEDSGRAVFVATDSFRLAEKRVAMPKGAGVMDMLIPFKNSVEIVRAMESVGGEVKVNATKNIASFEAEGVRVTSRVVDGVFPDYKQIVPKGGTTEAVALKKDLSEALKMSSVFSDSFNQVKMVVDPNKKLFRITTKNNDIGENETDIEAALSGEPLEVNFNCRYVSDCLQSIDADSVSLQWNGKNRALVIRPVSGDQTFMYIVMPMNR